jgi:phosphoadenosine phosphosulfate reductase
MTTLSASASATDCLELEQEPGSLACRATLLAQRYAGSDALTILRHVIQDAFPGRIALVSSFGAESAVLLDLVARIDKATPIVFLDTGKLFGETLRYRDQLVARLGLTGMRVIRPDEAALQAEDPEGVLWLKQPNRCCFVRKVEPLRRALEGFDAWITGRKRFQGGLRGDLRLFEVDAGRIKVNPLAGWTKADLDDYFAKHNLPRHPLEADGFLSIGCMPCTDRVAPDEDVRAGRWRGTDKTECGIHLSLDSASL